MTDQSICPIVDIMVIGRPAEFDREEALEKAMGLFWRNGYEATGLTELTNEMGIGRQSLHNAFGDKHSLFLQALQRYLAEMRATESKVLRNAPTPLEGLRNAAHHRLDFTDCSGECPRGCMAVNSLVELAPHDDSVRQVLNEHMGYMRKMIGGAIGDAQTAGQIQTTRPPELLTGMLMTFLAGLVSLLKSGMATEDAHRLLDAQLDAIFSIE